MTYSERLWRRRCIGLRVAALFGILLAAFNWRDWVIVAIGVGGAIFVLLVYWRDCRRSRDDASHTRA